MKSKYLAIITTVAMTLFVPVSTEAAIVVSGDVGTTTPLTVQITAPINFTVTQDGDFRFLAFDEWVTSDGGENVISFNSASLSYQINGGSTQFIALTQVADNFAGSSGALSANDGYLQLSSAVALTNGQTLTILGGTFVTDALTLPSNLNPAMIQTFNGDALLLSDGGLNALSAATPVPEPGSLLLGLVGSVLLLRRRRAAVVAY